MRRRTFEPISGAARETNERGVCVCVCVRSSHLNETRAVITRRANQLWAARDPPLYMRDCIGNNEVRQRQ